jgi:WD40 repeat protein
VQLSPDEDLLALATLEEVAILDWERGTVVATIPTQTEDVAFDHSGRLIATAGDDRTPEIWKVDTGELVATLSPQPGDIYGLGFSPDGSLLAVGSADGTIRLFDVRSGRLVTLPSYEQAVGEVAFSPDGSLLAVTTADGQARIWSLDLDDLLHIAQHKLTRSLTEEECRLYLHVETCPQVQRLRPD